MGTGKKKAVTGGIIAGVALIVLGTAGYFIFSQDNSSGAVPEFTVSAVRLEKQDLENSINISGVIKGEEHPIENLQRTKCIKVNVSEGDFVNKGDVLFEFDRTTIQNEYNKLVKEYNNERGKLESQHQINQRNLVKAEESHNAEYAEAQKKVDDAENARNAAYSKYNELVDRFNSLSAKIVELSELGEEYAAEYAAVVEEYDALDSQIEELKAGLDAYENAVTAAYAELKSIRNNDTVQQAKDALDSEKYYSFSVEQKDLDILTEQMENCVIKAECSGIITGLGVSEDAVPSGQLLATIVDNSDYFVTAELPETKIYKLEEGMNAVLKTVATEEMEIPGVIKSVSKLATQTGEGNSYSVKIDITDDKIMDNVFIGMTSSVKVILNVTNDVYAVPYDSIMTDKDGNKFVYTAEPFRDIYKVGTIEVETGEENGYYTEISGTKVVKDVIVITNPAKLEEGTKIDVTFEE